MKKSGSNPSPEIISGKCAWFVLQRLRLFFLWNLLKLTRNPFKTVSEVRKMQQLRNSIHGNNRIKKFVKTGNKYYWVTNLPAFPTENLKRMISVEYQRNQIQSGTETGPIPQQSLFWGITNRCQLTCKHCYEWDNIDSHEHLTSDQLMLILEKIENQGIRHVQLSGGEPLVRFDDLVSIIRKASSTIDFWLLTSGFGLTIEKAVALKNAGLKGVMVSLDHWDKTLHNDFRMNPNSFEWVEKAVENCKNSNLMTGLSLCATRVFVSEENLEKYATLSLKMGVNFIRLLEPRATGKFANQKVALNKMEIDTIIRFVIKVNNHPDYSEYPIVAFPGMHQRKLGCFGAGNRYFYIDASGEVYACPFCRDKGGNVLDQPLNTIIENLRKIGCQAFVDN